MGLVGIRKVYLGVQDADGNPILTTDKGFETGMIEITDQMLGVSAVNFQESANGEEVDGNNKQVDYIKAMPTASMDVSFNNLPFDVQQKILGREKVGQGYVNSLTNTYVMIIAESPVPNSNDNVYTALGKAVATSKGYNLQTSTSKKVNRISDEIQFEGLACDNLNDMPFITASTIEPGFSLKAFFDQICPGQTLIPADTVKTSDTSSVSK